MNGVNQVQSDATAATATVTRDEIRRTMSEYVTPNAKIGVPVFLLDFGLYWASIAGVLFLEPMWAKILCSVYAGIKLANLGTLGHEAAHGNMAISPWINKTIGVLAFLPCLYNYRLWVYDHHHVHHPSVNADANNSWAPFSKEQFDRLPPHRRMLERFYRSSFGLGLAAQNVIERWAPFHLIPGKYLPQRFHASSWRHAALLAVFAGAFIAAMITAPLYSNTSALTAMILGFGVPFFLWHTLFSFTVYVQHTHARIPWFDEAIDKKTGLPQESLSLHLQFPKPIRLLMHNVYEHAVHHVNVRVPFHRAAEAQAKLNDMVGEAAVVQPFSFGWLHSNLKACRLYDYENHRWLDFNGKPTGPETIKPEKREALRKSAKSAPDVAYA